MAICAVFLLVAGALPGKALAEGEPRPAWSPIGVSAPTNLEPGSDGTVVVYVQNVGGAPSSGTITIEDELPGDLSPRGAAEGQGWSCSAAGAIVCTTSQVVEPGAAASPVRIPVSAGAVASETVNRLAVVGGGGAEAVHREQVTIGAEPAKPGVQAFVAGLDRADGEPETSAGSHPYAATMAIFVNTVRGVGGGIVPAGEIKNLALELPPGLIVNSAAVPQCATLVTARLCPLAAQMGTVQPVVTNFSALGEPTPLHNRPPPRGFPASYTFEPASVLPIAAMGQIRASAPYAPAIEISHAPQMDPFYGVFLSFWGAPADSSHDGLRCAFPENQIGCGPGGADVAALTMPGDCAEQVTRPPRVTLRVDIWQEAGLFDQRSVSLPRVTGCERLRTAADLAIEPNRVEADSPAAFEMTFSSSVDGLVDRGRLGPALTREAIAELPAGVVIDPAVADGLVACTEAEVGLQSDAPARCPEASRIGVVEATTALLPGELPGTLYLAAPGLGNPFGSLFAFYVVIEDARTGVILKVPARVSLDPGTGQVTVELDELPQLPIEGLRLRFKGGPRALTATPTTCGRYPVHGTATPWSAPESGPPLEIGDAFAVDSGPDGSPCAATPAERPFAVRAVAGSDTRVAGAASSFDLQVTRPDGSQELEALEVALPAGVSAAPRGVPHCPEIAIEAARRRNAAAETASPSCPAESRVGASLAGVGSGPNPFYVAGAIYLAGPYRGAPLSLVSIVPALAGPFDLGNLVLRMPLEVDPVTARITARTDPLPRFLEGVGLRLRDLRMSLDRQGFVHNPTSCEPFATRITAHGDSGAVADLSNRFQVGGCESLGFKPRLSLRLGGAPPRRGGHPRVKAVLRTRPQDAGIRRAAIVLPETELLENANIRGVCPRARFAAGSCPARSVYGKATVWSSLLDEPLRGPVYLRAGERRLPDLVAALDGQLRIDLAARVDSVHGRVRTTFEGLPDIPVSRLALTLDGGRRGLLVNNTRLCRAQPRAAAFFRAHNNKSHRVGVAVGVEGCPKARSRLK